MDQMTADALICAEAKSFLRASHMASVKAAALLVAGHEATHHVISMHVNLAHAARVLGYELVPQAEMQEAA